MAFVTPVVEQWLEWEIAHDSVNCSMAPSWAELLEYNHLMPISTDIQTLATK